MFFTKFLDVWPKGFYGIILYVVISCQKHTVAPNQTFCRAYFAHFTLAQFWNNFSNPLKFKNHWFLWKKKHSKGWLYKVMHSSCINASELLKAETLCVRHYSCARLYICARGVQRSGENLRIFSLVSLKLVRKMSFLCWRIWSFWATILSSLMPKYVFMNT